MSNNPPLEQQKIKRIVAKRACLNCRNKKIKCDGEIVVFLEGRNQCTNCLLSNIDGCIFLPSKRGGRKPKLNKVDKKGKSLKDNKKLNSHSVDKIKNVDVFNKHKKPTVIANKMVHPKPMMPEGPIGYQQMPPQYLPNNPAMFNQRPHHMPFQEYLSQQVMPPLLYNNMVPMYPHMHHNNFQMYPPSNMVYNTVPSYYINPDNRTVQIVGPNNIQENLGRRTFSNIPSEKSLSNLENNSIDQNNGTEQNSDATYQLPPLQSVQNTKQPHFWNMNNKPQMMPQQGVFFNSRMQNKFPPNQGFNPNVLTPINNVKFLKNNLSASSVTNFSSKTLTPQLQTFPNLPKPKVGLIKGDDESQVDPPPNEENKETN